MITESFDNKTKAIIEPIVNENAPYADACIVTFSDEVERFVMQNYDCRQIGELDYATHTIPVYLIDYNGGRYAFYKTMIGAPACVGTVEDTLSVIKTNKYIVFGTAGCLDKEIARGKVIVPTDAYRDEGTSYHYAPAADYISVTNYEVVGAFMRVSGIPCVEGNTWTTDAFYRETEGNFLKRKAERCVSVEMECSALQAMCDFRGLELFVFFTGDDLLDAPEWDKRSEDGGSSGARCVKIALGLAEFVREIELENSGADRILTLNDWWDGPLLGLCTFGGEYCVYERIFSEEIDDYSDDYYLTPIEERSAREILEGWKQWCDFINGGGDTDDWESKCDDIFGEAKLSPRYRQFKKHAEFKGVPQHYAENIRYYFVVWS